MSGRGSPWVLKRLESKDERDSDFKDHVANLAANWVKDEHNLKVSSWKYIKSLYKGGEGERGFDPVAFSEPKRKRRERRHQKKKKQKRKKRDVMSSPSELLSHMRDSTELNTTTTTKVELRFSETKTTDRKSLIQELDESGKVIKKKKKKKTKPAVRKGFLHRKSKTRLCTLTKDRTNQHRVRIPGPMLWIREV